MTPLVFGQENDPHLKMERQAGTCLRPFGSGHWEQFNFLSFLLEQPLQPDPSQEMTKPPPTPRHTNVF